MKKFTFLLGLMMKPFMDSLFTNMNIPVYLELRYVYILLLKVNISLLLHMKLDVYGTSE